MDSIERRLPFLRIVVLSKDRVIIGATRSVYRISHISGGSEIATGMKTMNVPTTAYNCSRQLNRCPSVVFSTIMRRRELLNRSAYSAPNRSIPSSVPKASLSKPGVNTSLRRFLRPLSSHCAEHPAKGLPDSSDPHSTGWPARSSLGYHSSIFVTTSPDSVSRLSLELYLTHGRM